MHKQAAKSSARAQCRHKGRAYQSVLCAASHALQRQCTRQLSKPITDWCVMTSCQCMPCSGTRAKMLSGPDIYLTSKHTKQNCQAVQLHDMSAHLSIISKCLAILSKSRLLKLSLLLFCILTTFSPCLQHLPRQPAWRHKYLSVTISQYLGDGLSIFITA